MSQLHRIQYGFCHAPESTDDACQPIEKHALARYDLIDASTGTCRSKQLLALALLAWSAVLALRKCDCATSLTSSSSVVRLCRFFRHHRARFEAARSHLRLLALQRALAQLLQPPDALAVWTFLRERHELVLRDVEVGRWLRVTVGVFVSTLARNRYRICSRFSFRRVGVGLLTSCSFYLFNMIMTTLMVMVMLVAVRVYVDSCRLVNRGFSWRGSALPEHLGHGRP